MPHLRAGLVHLLQSEHPEGRAVVCVQVMQGHLSRPPRRVVCGLQISSAGHVLRRLRESEQKQTPERVCGARRWTLTLYHRLLRNKPRKEHVITVKMKKCSVEQTKDEEM